MALAKDHQATSCTFYGNMIEPGSSSIQFPHIISPYDQFDDYIQKQDGDGLDSPSNNKIMNNQILSHSSPLSSSSSANSSNGGFAIHPCSSYQTNSHEEVHSLMNFKTGFESFIHNSCGGSLLSFQHDPVDHQANNNNNHNNNNSYNYQVWESLNQNQHSQLFKPLKNNNGGNNMGILDEVNCLQTTNSDYQDAMSNDQWLYAEATVTDPPQESASQHTCFNKRPHMEGENFQPMKKQCTTNTSKKPTKAESSTSKDPQSVAAKNRRERISERLKILQDLVPNGSKVDLVTMLEKAISYVKFLQLQVKVLATDEFWPAAGGKAPDISQVREAIDAILSSQRSERTTMSSSSK